MVVRDVAQETLSRIADFALRRIVGPGARNTTDPGFTASEGELTARALLPERPREKVVRDFWVISENDRPEWVVKLPALATDAKVAAEYSALVRLRVAPDIAVVPQALCALGGGFVMTYLSGWDLPELLTNQDWAGFEQITLDVVRRIGLMHHRWVAGGSADAVRAQAESIAGEDREVLDFVEPHLTGCRIGAIHGDLGPWNVRVDPRRGTVGLLDWEDSKPVGLLAIDILAFVFTVPLVAHPQYPQRGYDWLYDTALVQDERLVELIIRMLVTYGEITGQPPGRIARLLPLFCRYMINRISAEGRDPSRFFFGRFRQRFIAAEPPWLAGLPNELESR